MLNIKKILIATTVSLGIFLTANNVVSADTTLSYKDVDGVKCVNIVELARLKGEQISGVTHEVYGKGYNITFDGKLVTIYEEAPCIFIDGKMTVLKTEVISADGLEYNFPVMQTPAKEGDGFLIPMFVVEKNLGIKGSEEGIVVEKPKEDTNTGNNNSNSGSNNSGSSNNGSNSGNSGNNGTTTPAPKPDPKPEQPSGMSFSTFAGKLSSLGFDSNGTYWENGVKMGKVRVSSDRASFGLHQNSSSFNNVIKNSLNMLLPTGGNKVYSIVSSSFSNQTLNLDGRKVVLQQFSDAVIIDIYDN
ncbi:MAG: hypothetical protein ACLUDK_14905 [Clostridium paraputrificum]